MNAMVSSRRWFVSRRARVMLLAVTVMLTLGARAQSPDDDDEDDGPMPATATLALHYSARGDVDVNFHTEVAVQNPAAVEAALEATLHCPAGALTHPQAGPPSKYVQSLPAKARARYEEFLAESRKNTLSGNCSDSMRRQGLLLSTELPVSSLAAQLKHGGLQQLWLTLSYPESKFAEHTPSSARQIEGYQYARTDGVSAVRYNLDLGVAAPASLHLAFGMRVQDAIGALVLPVGFLLLPIAIVLWMQRAALRDAKRDPTGAWFSYLRVLVWCGNGLLLLWMLGHSIRHGLEEVLAYNLAGHGAGTVALSVAVFMMPPWIAYLVCILSSYRVYVQVKGETWTRGEFFANQLLGIAGQLLPLMCFLAGMGMVGLSFRVSMGLFVAAYISHIACRRLKVKVSGMHPEALTTGELRDRVFELAKKAVVEVRQVFIMPAGKSQMANAFASRNKMVIFTDYLLNRLDKREVSAVAAHEITHVQKKHVMWGQAGLIGLILSPILLRGVMSAVLGAIRPNVWMHIQGSEAGMAGLAAFLEQVLKFPELDLIFYVIGLSLYYLQSRHMERVADAGAVQLTQDSEAVITGLLKIGHLNLLPVQWGRVTGSLLTHPSTLKRVERVARLGQVTPERLQELLRQYQNPEAQLSTADSMVIEERFTEAQVSQDRVLTMESIWQLQTKKIWVLRLLHFVPAAMVAWGVNHWHIQTKGGSYIVGGIVCLAIYAWVAEWSDAWGRAGVQRAFQRRLEAEGIAVSKRSALVALSPHGVPRLYASGFDWDTGYLFLAKERLCFAGDQMRFALRPDQVREVRLTRGVPGWIAVPHVYVDWWDESTGALRTWNLVSKTPGPFWRYKEMSREIFGELQKWKLQAASYAEAPVALRELAAPVVGEVTSQSLESIFTAVRFFQTIFVILLLAVGACAAIGVSAIWYVCGMVVLLHVWSFVPLWLYKEPKPVEKTMVAVTATETL